MKALSLKQPYASLIVEGLKTIETRTWATKYRGQILLLASASIKRGRWGHAVAVADLVDCREMTKKDEKAACCKIYPNAKAWILSNIRPIKPFPAKGKLGLFNFTDPYTFYYLTGTLLSAERAYCEISRIKEW